MFRTRFRMRELTGKNKYSLLCEPGYFYKLTNYLYEMVYKALRIIGF